MKAIVTGVSGQDGFYMTTLLAERGVHVLGLTTDIDKAKREFASLSPAKLELQSFDYLRLDAFAQLVDAYKPDYIFNFAAKTTGGGMFDAPYEMNRLNGAFVVDILEAIRRSDRKDAIAFCQASSSEMFGTVQETPQIESTCFRPKSPYGAAKLYAHNTINIYRSVYGLRCCSAILYNHESVRRPTQFVTKKIANGAARIKLDLVDHLELGDLGTCRDWGYAPEYMEALYAMATAARQSDYVVATGQLNTIKRLCEIAFGYLGLDYREFVRSTAKQSRIVESVDLCGNPTKIRQELNWCSRRPVDQIMIEMVDYEIARLKSTG